MTKLLIDWLAEKYPSAKRTTFKQMLEGGRVLVNGRPARRLKTELGEKDVVRVLERSASRRDEVRQPPFPIVYEDADLLVVNKPAGLLTSTVPREPRPTLLAMVRQYVGQREPRARIGLIHRLDRDAEGLLVLSKNNAAYESLKTQFYKHTVRRVYTAVVVGVPRERKGRIESNLSERTDGTVHTIKQIGKGEHAITDYEVVRDNGKRALLRVTLQTGRKHQIRVHLSERGTPIVGDAVYGKQPIEKNARLMLVATELAVTHPGTGKLVEFAIPVPPEFQEAVG